MKIWRILKHLVNNPGLDYSEMIVVTERKSEI